MEPGVVDLNLMPTDALAALVEAANAELAGRQTQDAIVRDVTAVVDPIIRDNRALLGDAWESGRVSWDGHCLTVGSPPEETPAPAAVAEPEPAPEPVSYEVGDNVPVGAVVEWGGRLMRVITGHQRTDRWDPDTKPGWFEAVDDA